MQATGYVALLTSIALDLFVNSLVTAMCILDAGVFTAWIIFFDEFIRHSIRSGYLESSTHHPYWIAVAVSVDTLVSHSDSLAKNTTACFNMGVYTVFFLTLFLCYW